MLAPSKFDASGYFTFVLPGGLVLPEGQNFWILSLLATVVDSCRSFDVAYQVRGYGHDPAIRITSGETYKAAVGIHVILQTYTLFFFVVTYGSS